MTLSDRFCFELIEGPVDPERVRLAVCGKDAGSVVLFVGSVRGEAKGEKVLRLEYEAWEETLGAVLEKMGEKAFADSDVLRMSVEHSVGILEPGEPTVAVAVASGHRAAGFKAAEQFMKDLKSKAPLWKKEVRSSSAEWVGE